MVIYIFFWYGQYIGRMNSTRKHKRHKRNGGKIPRILNIATKELVALSLDYSQWSPLGHFENDDKWKSLAIPDIEVRLRSK
jgi:hypothetical protein